MNDQGKAAVRIGIGYDIHKLVSGRPLILGGVPIPSDKGLLGHSDGDGLLHAVSDALLGAAALGDIGKHFPDTDPAFKDADSQMLLRRVVHFLREKGWRAVNVDTNIVAQKPKLAPFLLAMRDAIAKAMEIEVECVSVKARTNEGLDAVGGGEAIATQAVVLIERTET